MLYLACKTSHSDRSVSVWGSSVGSPLVDNGLYLVSNEHRHNYSISDTRQELLIYVSNIKYKIAIFKRETLKFWIFCSSFRSPTHTGLICVKTFEQNISSLGPLMLVLYMWYSLSHSTTCSIYFIIIALSKPTMVISSSFSNRFHLYAVVLLYGSVLVLYVITSQQCSPEWKTKNIVSLY